ncbi:MAG TPA: tripartite tricarboxylate transporter substrate binding protein [Xanthobacteraceae bacterium]|nr:tripartite tricarboxylate transporter substrate binding protein [Xanthobacteraceae bacterium]
MQDISRRGFTIGAGALAAGLAMPGILRAQDKYPSRDVHFICAFPPGSGADVIVRWYAEKLRPIMGVNIVVENKVGALAHLATEYTVRAKPDGYTIYVHGPASLAINQYVIKNSTVDVTKDIVIAGAINRQPMMMMVKHDSPWKTVADVTKAVRAKGDKATYGISNPVGKVMGALYKNHEKLEAVEVTYRTASDALNDLASGAIDYGMFDNIFGAAQARAGRVRLLGISMPERLQAMADIPTMSEQGVPMSVIGGFAAMVPSATPQPIVDRIFAMFEQVTRTPEAKTFLNTIASDPWVTTQPKAQAGFIEEVKAYGEYVRLAKIEPQG